MALAMVSSLEVARQVAKHTPSGRYTHALSFIDLIVVSVFTRGLLRRLVTRIYFPDDEANSEDYALNLVEPGRRHTLIAKKSAKREGVLEWNVVLQGSDRNCVLRLLRANCWWRDPTQNGYCLWPI